MAPFREIYSWKKNFSKGNVPDQMNMQSFPKLAEVTWPLSPCPAGVNPYWIGDMDCTAPRKAVPFRERQPHALHTNRKSLSQQLDCSGGRTPVSAMGNHLKNRKTKTEDLWLTLETSLAIKIYLPLRPKQGKWHQRHHQSLAHLFPLPHEEQERHYTNETPFFSTFSHPLPWQALQCVQIPPKVVRATLLAHYPELTTEEDPTPAPPHC